MKVLFDTCVFISAIGRISDTDKIRRSKANFVISKCDESKWKKCISVRTNVEFENGWKSGKVKKNRLIREKLLLKKFVTVGYHSGNENWEDVECNWEDCHTKWGDNTELKIADKIKEYLKDDKHKCDRGILFDAIQNKCEIIVSEDWSDFKKIYDVGKKYGVTICTPENIDEII